MPLLPTHKPQLFTRSKSAVIKHIRETAPDKIDVIPYVNAQNLNLVIAHLRKITADSETSLLIIVAAPAK